MFQGDWFSNKFALCKIDLAHGYRTFQIYHFYLGFCHKSLPPRALPRSWKLNFNKYLKRISISQQMTLNGTEIKLLKTTRIVLLVLLNLFIGVRERCSLKWSSRWWSLTVRLTWLPLFVFKCRCEIDQAVNDQKGRFHTQNCPANGNIDQQHYNYSSVT